MERGRTPFVGAVSQAGFRAFVTSAPVVVLRVSGRIGLRFAPSVARHFTDKLGERVRLGVLDRSQVEERWLVEVLGSDEPDGYYLFRDGAAAGFCAARLRGLDPRGARQVIASFDAVLDAAAGPDPYRVLDVSPAATDAEVKAAWRKAMKLNHPDRVAHLSKRLQEVAQEETRAADEAYNAIRRLRGIRA